MSVCNNAPRDKSSRDFSTTSLAPRTACGAPAPRTPHSMHPPGSGPSDASHSWMRSERTTSRTRHPLGMGTMRRTAAAMGVGDFFPKARARIETEEHAEVHEMVRSKHLLVMPGAASTAASRSMGQTPFSSKTFWRRRRATAAASSSGRRSRPSRPCDANQLRALRTDRTSPWSHFCA